MVENITFTGLSGNTIQSEHPIPDFNYYEIWQLHISELSKIDVLSANQKGVLNSSGICKEMLN